MKMFDKTTQQSNINSISKQPNVINLRKVEEKKPEQTIPILVQPEQSQTVQIMIAIPNNISPLLQFIQQNNK